MKPSLICDFISLPLHTVTSAVLQSHSLYQNQIEPPVTPAAQRVNLPSEISKAI